MYLYLHKLRYIITISLRITSRLRLTYQKSKNFISKCIWRYCIFRYSWKICYFLL